jgi:hypothetical protein
VTAGPRVNDLPKQVHYFTDSIWLPHIEPWPVPAKGLQDRVLAVGSGDNHPHVGPHPAQFFQDLPAGTLLALYRSATENVHRDIYLLASNNNGKSFQGSLIHRWEINACPMSSMSFTESAGNTLATWETGDQVFHGKVSGTAVPNIIAAPGDAKGRKHSRLAVNSRGETLLVWTEGTGWQRGGSLAWQIFDSNGKPSGDKGRFCGR